MRPFDYVISQDKESKIELRYRAVHSEKASVKSSVHRLRKLHFSFRALLTKLYKTQVGNDENEVYK